MWKKIVAACALCLTSLSWAALDVNTADAQQLTQLKGIGPSTADNIIKAREQGNFQSWDDFIQRVKGIGKASANKLSEQGLTINGKNYEGVATTVSK